MNQSLDSQRPHGFSKWARFAISPEVDILDTNPNGTVPLNDPLRSPVIAETFMPEIGDLLLIKSTY